MPDEPVQQEPEQSQDAIPFETYPRKKDVPTPEAVDARVPKSALSENDDPTLGEIAATLGWPVHEEE